MQQPTGRVCTRCNEYKLFTEFNKARNGTYGYESLCRRCKKQKYFENRDVRLERNRRYYQQTRVKWLEYHREYRETHREEIKDYHRNRYAENRDQIRAERRQWARENPDRIKRWKHNDYVRNRDRHREAGRKWRNDNPDKSRDSSRRAYRKDIQKSRMRAISKHHRRRAQLLGRGSYTVYEWQAMCDWFGNVCLCCGIGDTLLTVDHVVPVIHHGVNTIDNLQPLCLSCNSRKGAKTIDYRDPDSLAELLNMLNRRD